MPTERTLRNPRPDSLVPHLLQWGFDKKNHGCIFETRTRPHRTELRLRPVGLGDHIARLLGRRFVDGYVKRNQQLAGWLLNDLQRRYALDSFDAATRAALQPAYEEVAQALRPFALGTDRHHFKLQAIAEPLQRLDALVLNAQLDRQLMATRRLQERWVCSSAGPMARAAAPRAQALFWTPPSDLLDPAPPVAPRLKVEALTAHVNRCFPTMPGHATREARLDDPQAQQANEAAMAEHAQQAHASHQRATKDAEALQQDDPACADLFGVLQHMGDLVGQLNACADRVFQPPEPSQHTNRRTAFLRAQADQATRRLLVVLGGLSASPCLGPRHRHLTRPRSAGWLVLDQGRSVATTLAIDAAIGLQQLQMLQTEWLRTAQKGPVDVVSIAFAQQCAELMRTTEGTIARLVSIGKGLARLVRRADLHPQDRLVIARLSQVFLTLADGLMQPDLPYAQAHALAREGMVEPTRVMRQLRAAAQPRAADVLSDVIRQVEAMGHAAVRPPAAAAASNA